MEERRCHNAYEGETTSHSLAAYRKVQERSLQQKLCLLQRSLNRKAPEENSKFDDFSQNEFRVKGVLKSKEKLLGSYEFDISDYFGS